MSFKGGINYYTQQIKVFNHFNLNIVNYKLGIHFLSNSILHHRKSIAAPREAERLLGLVSMYNHGVHLSLIIVIVFYMITLNMHDLVYYVIIVYYHLVLIIRLFMNSTCSHNRISEWGMVQAIGVQILYWLSDHILRLVTITVQHGKTIFFNH